MPTDRPDDAGRTMLACGMSLARGPWLVSLLGLSPTALLLVACGGDEAPPAAPPPSQVERSIALATGPQAGVEAPALPAAPDSQAPAGGPDSADAPRKAESAASKDEPVFPDNWCGTGAMEGRRRAPPPPMKLLSDLVSAGRWNPTEAKGVYRRRISTPDRSTRTRIQRLQYGRRLNGTWVVWSREAERVRRELEAEKPGSAPLPPSIKVPGHDTRTKYGEWLPVDGAGIYLRSVYVVGPDGEPQYSFEYGRKVDGKWETWTSPIGWGRKPDEPRPERRK